MIWSIPDHSIIINKKYRLINKLKNMIKKKVMMIIINYLKKRMDQKE